MLRASSRAFFAFLAGSSISTLGMLLGNGTKVRAMLAWSTLLRTRYTHPPGTGARQASGREGRSLSGSPPSSVLLLKVCHFRIRSSFLVDITSPLQHG